MVVALRTAACDFALPDTTTAPSIPRKSHSVTSMVACTCGMTLSQLNVRSTAPFMPQKPSMNTENLNTVATAMMKMATGSSLPMVQMSWKPARKSWTRDKSSSTHWAIPWRARCKTIRTTPA